MNFNITLFCVFACLKFLHNSKICLKIEDFFTPLCVCIDSTRIYHFCCHCEQNFQILRGNP
ncbi:hypothetical protein HFN_0900 [Helicobacter fennelliae MRY12-0050]|uniref:Uncharacterized protein n=1 Tax=Helicobacter fennelliae MRY12-0050 TaxID=1325130 RepID=T1D0E1_9HELI|nr:hypothetical protein HFN_0900 [Helicobacter fennelliae MRY12-0050]